MKRTQKIFAAVLLVGIFLGYGFLIHISNTNGLNTAIVAKIDSSSVIAQKTGTSKLDSIKNEIGEYDIQVQSRMAVAAERTVWLASLSTLAALLIGGLSIYFSLYQWSKNRKWEIGGIEIDFDRLQIEDIAHASLQFKFKARYHLIYSGKSMVRLISTRFDLEPMDFMYLQRNWWRKLESHESEDHKILVEGEKTERATVSETIFTHEEYLNIIEPIERPRLKTSPLVLRGYVKYNDGAGETWIKPYIFRFEWRKNGPIAVIPWSKHCEPVKKYPTFRTWVYEKGETNKFMSPFWFWIFNRLRD